VLKPRRTLVAARKAADRVSGRPAADRSADASAARMVAAESPNADVKRRRKTGKQKRIIVAGSRTFDRYSLLKKVMNKIADEKYPDYDIVLLSGAAKGADTFGERWAFARWFTVERYYADWRKFRKQAGSVRNGEMVKAAEMLVAFWDGKSPGTRDVIAQARRKGLKVKVVKFKER
jgi:hypothetical protein